MELNDVIVNQPVVIDNVIIEYQKLLIHRYDELALIFRPIALYSM